MVCRNSTDIRAVSPMNKAFAVSEGLYPEEKAVVVGKGGTIGVDMQRYDICLLYTSIDTLARNLIKLSGYKPDEDIKVVYTGLRPGEKLYEEKLMAEEGMTTTPNQLLHKPIPFDMERFMKQLDVLAAASFMNSPDIVRLVAGVVPTFHTAESDLQLHQDTYDALMQETLAASEAAAADSSTESSTNQQYVRKTGFI